MSEPTGAGGPSIEPTRGEWLKAIIFVLVVAVVATAFVIWFAFTFLLQSCCLSA